MLSCAEVRQAVGCQALMSHHNASTPLFGQAAAYLDTHATKGIQVKAKDAAAAKARSSRPHSLLHAQQAEVEATAQSLQKFADSLQKSFDARTKQHSKRMKELDTAMSKAKSKKDKLMLKSIEKREERNYKKWAAMQKHDIDAMKSAVAAVKKGDMKALDRAQAPLCS